MRFVLMAVVALFAGLVNSTPLSVDVVLPETRKGGIIPFDPATEMGAITVSCGTLASGPLDLTHTKKPPFEFTETTVDGVVYKRTRYLIDLPLEQDGYCVASIADMGGNYSGHTLPPSAFTYKPPPDTPELTVTQGKFILKIILNTE